MQIIEQKRCIAERKYISVLSEESKDLQPYSLKNLKKRSDFLLNATLRAEELEVDCGVLVKVGDSSLLGRYSYEPTIFAGTYKISKEQRIELAFVGHVLGQVQGHAPVVGRIIGADGKPHKVKLENTSKTLMPLLNPLQEWVETSVSILPPVILNKHCPYCQFQSDCREKAEKEDNLSLLDRITPKLIQKYQKKGLFTINQLSYLYRPRRQRKRKNQLLQFKPEYQALAIRTGKIYIQELPKIYRNSVELFLDIEGIPDQDFDYLIGLLVREKYSTTPYSFWADTIQDEEKIWRRFLEEIGKYPGVPIYHYGSYEPRAIQRLSKKYQTDCDKLKACLINLNSYIYGKIYFPLYSNRLKEIGNFIGASWASSDSSGLQSLVWRYRWEETQKNEYEQKLIIYNQEDCQALQLLADRLSKIAEDGDSQQDIDFVDKPKQNATDRGKGIHKELEHILRYAYADYDKKKISMKRREGINDGEKKKRGAPKGHQGFYRIRPSRAGTTIEVDPGRECPKAKNHQVEISKVIAEKIIIDLHFTQNGCKKRIIKYVGNKVYCQKCDQYYSPPAIEELKSRIFGHNFQAWIIYQRIILRLPYKVIAQTVQDLFGESISPGSITGFVRKLGEYYLSAEQASIQRILESPIVHVDETKVNIQGAEHYVWVFTDGQHIVFRKTETRETQVVHEFLSEYSGVLISDFYPGYDSVNCKQQKCWSHLIRDINEDLWKEPYNGEFESFVLEVRNLIVPIIHAVAKYGLRKRNLNKFKKWVKQFYKKNIDNRDYKSDVTIKYQKRFQRYKESLFTFLEEDDIPWNNNMAERSIRHLAIQRKISGSFFDSLIKEYLLLLGIAQTCRFQDKPFLKFLLSQEQDVDQFKTPRQRKHSKSAGSPRSREDSGRSLV